MRVIELFHRLCNRFRREAVIPEVHKTLSKWNLENEMNKLIRSSQISIVQAFVSSIMSSSIIMDKFISWILAITGGLLILAFSNLSTTVNIFPDWLLIAGFIGIFLTGVFGFISKNMAMRFHSLIKVAEVFQINAELLSSQYLNKKETLTKEAEQLGCNLESKPDSDSLISAIMEVFGEKHGIKFIEELKKVINDPLDNMKRTYRKFRIYNVFSILTQITFILTSIALILGVLT